MASFQMQDRIIDPLRYPWGFFRLLWTPAEITTALWLDAADSDTITLVSGAVSEWADKSGNDRHAVQETGAYRPVLAENSYGVLPAILFDGADDFLDLTSSATDIARNVGGFSVFHITQSNLSRNILRVSTPVVTSVRINASATSLAIRRLDADTFGDFSYGLSEPASITMTSCVVDYVAGTIHVARDGDYSFLTDDFNGGGNTSDTDSDGVWIGGYGPDATAQPYDGVVCEIIVLRSAASDSDRQLIEGYLAHKWGLEANLPSGHPYKNAAP